MNGPLISPLGSLPFIALLLWSGGCGNDNPETIPVRGRVTWGGKPLSGGTIIFLPAENVGKPTGHIATGRIQSDGSYEMGTFSNRDGVVPGSYQVAIDARDKLSTEDVDGAADATTDIPQRFASPATSGLTVDITEESSVHDFDLTR